MLGSNISLNNKKEFPMKNLSILTLTLFLFGCSTLSDNSVIDGSFINKIGASQVEKENSDSVSSKVIKGKTTKDEIQKIFGKPTSRSTDGDGNDTWAYSDINFTTNLAGYMPIPIVRNVFGHTKTQSKNLIIIFNKNGIVENYTFNENGY